MKAAELRAAVTMNEAVGALKAILSAHREGDSLLRGFEVVSIAHDDC